MITQRNFWFFFGGLWFAVGVLFAAIGAFVLWQHLTLNEQLARDGATAAGIVLSKRMRGGSNQTTFQVEYRFKSADGAVTERTAEVDGKTWDSLVEGEAVEVLYVRGAPGLHRLPGEYPERLILGLIFSVVGGLFAIAGAIILWRATARRKLVERLLREGARAAAEVIEVMPTNFRINQMPQWAIRYRYRDQFGKTHDGKTPPMPQEEARLWKPGNRGQVGFERNRPQRSIWIGKS